MLMIWCTLALAVKSTVATADAACEPGLDGNFYRREILYQISSSSNIYFPTVNWKTNMIYFITKRLDSEFASAVMDLSKRHLKHSIIPELPNFCKFAIDQPTGEIYAGCLPSDGRVGGLYKLDSNVKKFVLIRELVKGVKCVQYGDTLYFCDIDKKLHKFIHGRVQEVPDVQKMVFSIVILPNGDKIFFSFMNRYVYYQKADMKEAVAIDGSYGVILLTMDHHGDTYGCSFDGIYHINTTTLTTRPVYNVNRCCGLATDSEGNFIYTEFATANIFRLTK